jgi:hypothetical protein
MAKATGVTDATDATNRNPATTTAGTPAAITAASTPGIFHMTIKVSGWSR